jgi:hypothetical protein
VSLASDLWTIRIPWGSYLVWRTKKPSICDEFKLIKKGIIHLLEYFSWRFSSQRTIHRPLGSTFTNSYQEHIVVCHHMSI